MAIEKYPYSSIDSKKDRTQKTTYMPEIRIYWKDSKRPLSILNPITTDKDYSIQILILKLIKVEGFSVVIVCLWNAL